MKPQSGAGRRVLLKAAAAVALALSVSSVSLAQEREIKVGYMKNPIQDASLDIMDKWAKANNVKLTRIPMAYSVFMEKVTATLTSGADQFDMIWHNDDWGQLWKKWLDTTDDVKGIENADPWPLLAFWNDDKKLTTVPMAHTVGTFFYRKDLVKAGGSAQDLRRARHGQPAPAEGRQGQVGLRRRHVDEQHLVQLLVDHVGEPVRHPQAPVRA